MKLDEYASASELREVIGAVELAGVSYGTLADQIKSRLGLGRGAK